MSNLPKKAIPFYRPQITAEDQQAVAAVLESGWLTTGAMVQQFERAFEAIMQQPEGRALAVSSGTAALHLALVLAGIAPGDAVLLPSLTFTATAEVVRYCGGWPIFVDSCPRSLTMDVAHAQRLLQELQWGLTTLSSGQRLPEDLAGQPLRAKALIAVHYGGKMADMFALQRLAELYKITLIEDAAHTLPAAIRQSSKDTWRPVGALSSMACFSFYANKCITTGEGGMLWLSDGAMYEKARCLSLHGIDRTIYQRSVNDKQENVVESKKLHHDYAIVAAGFKYNLSDMAAALGLSQLRRLYDLQEKRQYLANRYREGLKGLADLILPEDHSCFLHSWHLFALLLPASFREQDRFLLRQHLLEKGIQTSVHWQPLHQQPYYRQAYALDDLQLPAIDRFSDRCLSLPLYADLLDKEQDYIIETIGQYMSQ